MDKRRGFTLVELLGNSHYCAAYVDIDAGTGTGKETGKAGYMSVAAETMGLFLFHVYGG